MNSSAIYLYCFTRPGVLPDNSQDGFSLHTFRDIAAVVKEVPLDEFCGTAAEARMQDLAWVGPQALRHEEVVEQIMRYAPVFPVCFGTVFSSLSALEELVNSRYETVLQFLDYAADKQEWAVKGLLDKAKAKREISSAALAEKSADLAQLSPGRRYFLEQRILDKADRELSLWLENACHGISGKFSPLAADSRQRRIFSRKTTGGDKDMVLNWAFLIPQNLLPDFQAQIDKLNADYASQGLTLECSGPWPPYSFLPSLTSFL